MYSLFWAKLGGRMTTKKVSGLKLMLKTSVVSGMTLISRILGLVRDIVFARFFGASLVMDAFLVANRIPNMLRRFFAEGAFSQGFVPVMARYREQHDHQDAQEFVDSIAGTLASSCFSLLCSVLWPRRYSLRSSRQVSSAPMGASSWRR